MASQRTPREGPSSNSSNARPAKTRHRERFEISLHAPPLELTARPVRSESVTPMHLPQLDLETAIETDQLGAGEVATATTP